MDRRRREGERLGPPRRRERLEAQRAEVREVEAADDDEVEVTDSSAKSEESVEAEELSTLQLACETFARAGVHSGAAGQELQRGRVRGGFGLDQHKTHVACCGGAIKRRGGKEWFPFAQPECWR